MGKTSLQTQVLMGGGTEKTPMFLQNEQTLCVPTKNKIARLIFFSKKRNLETWYPL